MDYTRQCRVRKVAHERFDLPCEEKFWAWVILDDLLAAMVSLLLCLGVRRDWRVGQQCSALFFQGAL